MAFLNQAEYPCAALTRRIQDWPVKIKEEISAKLWKMLPTSPELCFTASLLGKNECYLP
jgi:hypothetical protein